MILSPFIFNSGSSDIRKSKLHKQPPKNPVRNHRSNILKMPCKNKRAELLNLCKTFKGYLR